MSQPITLSNKMLALIAQAPVTTKRPRIKPPFKQRLIEVLERHVQAATNK